MIAVVLPDPHFHRLSTGRETTLNFLRPVLDRHKELFVKKYYFCDDSDGIEVGVELLAKETDSVSYVLTPKAVLNIPRAVTDCNLQGGVK